MKLYHYDVTGGGTFPLDMLRHDAAWPRTSDDVLTMDKRDHRTIKLTSIREPTLGRWSSFMWRVDHIAKITV